MLNLARNIPGTFFLVTSIDPTRTITIRQRFVTGMRSRFGSLMADIKEAVVDLDVLGIGIVNRVVVNANSGLSPKQFNFPQSDKKIEAFVKWMLTKANEYILSGGTKGIMSTGGLSGNATDARSSWIKTHIDSAYQQGIRRGRQELRKLGVEIDEGQLGGDPIRVAFNSPVHADRVGMIYTRAYSSLKGITEEMGSVVSDVLALGIADGRGPKEIARLLNKTILGSGTGVDLGILDSLGRKVPSLRRAEVLARTEVIRAHHSANIAEYKSAGMMGIKIQVEHLTAGDERVCPKCAPLNGKRYDIDEAEYMIPVHPQCRCVAIPHIPDDDDDKADENSFLREDVPIDLKNDLLLATKGDGKERLVAIDGNGNKSSVSIGDEESVNLSKDWLKKLEDKNEKIHTIHTHPIEETLSLADIKSFSKLPGVKKVTAILPSGAEWSSKIVSTDLDGLYRRTNELFLEMKSEILDKLIEGEITKAESKMLMKKRQIELLKKLEKENWISLLYKKLEK